MNIFVLALSFVVIGSTCAQTSVNVTCTFDELSSCYNKVNSLGGNFTAEFDDSDLQLEKTCSHSDTAIKCLENVEQDCNSTVGNSLTDVIVLIRKLCNSTDIREKYLDHAKCYNKHIDSIELCAKDFVVKNPDDIIERCCEHFGWSKCVKDVTYAHCDKDAGDFRSMLVDKYRGYYISICAGEMEKCSASRLLLSMFTVLGTVLLFFVLFLF